MKKKNDNSFLEGGLVGFLSASILNNDPQKEKEYKELSDYKIQWKDITNQFEIRKNELEKHNLDTIVDLVEGEIKEIFTEAINCYLFGYDYAASNMIFLVIEILIREKTNNYDASIHKLIKNINELNSAQKAAIHQLWDQRNVQSHGLNKLKELTLLNVFDMMKDIALNLKEGK